MTEMDEFGRPQIPLDGDEATTLLGYLDYQRATLAWKCRGVPAEGLRQTVAASTMTLGGLLLHMALVEDHWFTRYVADQDMPERWQGVDWDADPDMEWRTAADHPPVELLAIWEESVDRSRGQVARALESGDLGQPAAKAFSNGSAPNLRWVVTHMIEEYARHNGHADLIREAFDGSTGE
jgi:uncharacterized damage-inducible protein DinB